MRVFGVGYKHFFFFFTVDTNYLQTIYVIMRYLFFSMLFQHVRAGVTDLRTRSYPVTSIAFLFCRMSTWHYRDLRSL